MAKTLHLLLLFQMHLCIGYSTILFQVDWQKLESLGLYGTNLTWSFLYRSQYRMFHLW